jgi:DNA replication protein DnaC
LTKKSKLLNILKINEEKLTPKYSCEKCNDTGIINKKVCECYKKIYSILFIEYFNIDINSFYNFNQAKIFDFNKKYFCEFQKYCDNFPNNKIKTLTFLGNTGTGKTFLAQCIASELINRNYNVIYISSFNLINILKEYHYSFSLNTKELLNVLIDCDMLIIDDLGSEPLEKNVTIEYILNILNERQFSNKHTLYTTNLNNAEIIDRYNERFFDRLNDKNTSKSIMLHNNNFRLKNN